MTDADRTDKAEERENMYMAIHSTTVEQIALPRKRKK